MRYRIAAVVVGSVALCALAVSLVAVEGSRDGTVTGVAAPCAGVVASSRYARIPVRISLQQGGRTVRAETVHGSSRFRLVAKAGTYLVTSDAMREAGPVTIRADETVRLDLVPNCKWTRVLTRRAAFVRRFRRWTFVPEPNLCDASRTSFLETCAIS